MLMFVSHRPSASSFWIRARAIAASARARRGRRVGQGSREAFGAVDGHGGCSRPPEVDRLFPWEPRAPQLKGQHFDPALEDVLGLFEVVHPDQ